jgi:nitrate reductase NapE component
MAYRLNHTQRKAVLLYLSFIVHLKCTFPVCTVAIAAVYGFAAFILTSRNSRVELMLLSINIVRIKETAY